VRIVIYLYIMNKSGDSNMLTAAKQNFVTVFGNIELCFRLPKRCKVTAGLFWDFK
jgi:hypothetical protein